MSRFRATFTSRHVLLPIIHVVSREQTLRNVAVARENGADGAFLISHGRVSDDELLDVHQGLVEADPRFWVGVNCLSLGIEEIFARARHRLPGIWVDDALIDEAHDEQPDAQRILDTRQARGWEGLYFGGVAFKYQRPVHDLPRAARLAAPFVDVVTTSGPGTGKAADPAKIRALRQGLGTHPLAIASGVTPENVTDYLAWADCFLVATGISYTFEELDPARLHDLVRVIRAWKPH